MEAGRKGRRSMLGLAVALALAGCASHPEPAAGPAPAAAKPDPEVYRRADADRIQLLEQENERLHADLRSAEETLVAVESGMRGSQTRTEAVSRLAEARIQVDRAAKRVPWRPDAAAEAREKLDEADRQLAAGHAGSAIFFASRASRIATNLLAESDEVAKATSVRRVKGERVNLRAEPSTTSAVLAVLPADLPVFPETDDGEWVLVRTVSGQVGWLRSGFLRAR